MCNEVFLGKRRLCKNENIKIEFSLNNYGTNFNLMIRCYYPTNSRNLFKCREKVEPNHDFFFILQPQSCTK